MKSTIGKALKAGIHHDRTITATTSNTVNLSY